MTLRRPLHPRICATGHRPQKLCTWEQYPIALERLKALAVAVLIKYQPRVAISGMALGWDTGFALAAIELGVDLVAVVPCEGQESRWKPEQQALYRDILNKAVEVQVLAKSYSPQVMQDRNKWMVDHADLVAALWDGSNGGTKNCIEYATQQNREILNAWKSWERYKGF